MRAIEEKRRKVKMRSDRKNLLKSERGAFEVWITPNGKRTMKYGNDIDSVLEEESFTDTFRKDSTATLYKRTIVYLLHAIGTLLTKIGMESFDRLIERASIQLMILLSKEHCPIRTIQFIQIISLLIFAVHDSLTNGGNSGEINATSCTTVQQRAVQVVLTIFAIILHSSSQYFVNINAVLDGTLPIPSNMHRLLPSLAILCEWMCTPLMTDFYAKIQNLNIVQSENIGINLWQTFEPIANVLVSAEFDRKLMHNSHKEHRKDNSQMCVRALLPESVYLASFLEFAPDVPQYKYFESAANNANYDNEILALHVRLSSLLSTAKHFSRLPFKHLSFDNETNRFIVTSTMGISKQFSQIRSSDSTSSNSNFVTCSYNDTVNAIITPNQDETHRDQVVIEVRPDYVVPDTNTFIDHLQSIKRIVRSAKFTLLVPTTVASELIGLSHSNENDDKGQSVLSDDKRSTQLRECATQAVNYLQLASDEKLANISTITSKGSRLPFVFLAAEQCNILPENKTINDDMILSSCSKLSAAMPQSKSINKDGLHSKLYRNVVLLTDDRALNIKATSSKIPCATIPNFIKWANI